MRKKFIFTVLTSAVLLGAAPYATAQRVYTLDSCRVMALENNKEIMIRQAQLRKAEYQKREAFAAYLPALDFAGAYLYNQKQLSLLGEDKFLPVKNFSLVNKGYEFALVKNPFTGEPLVVNGTPVPEQVAYMPKDALDFDIHNVFFGAVTLTQPIFMGGKIAAMNRLAHYGVEAARNLAENEKQNVVYAVDGAYWTVVSLEAKHKLATSYVNLLDTLQHNVQLMLDQGIATKSDLLGVDVKLNEAKVDLIKVENGLSLCRMALAQICDLPLNEQFTVADEGITRIDPQAPISADYDMEQVFAGRPDLRALQAATDAMGAKKRVALADMLPNLAVIGAYTFSNPNMFNGFEKKFNGMFSVGVMLKVPLWHWGGNFYKYKAAATDQTIADLQMQDAREKVTLQVNQAAYRAQEAVKTYIATEANLQKAGENLRTATMGFREGVIPSNDVMMAQTAWLKANSETIDAMIDVQLCDVYLTKVLGRMNY